MRHNRLPCGYFSYQKSLDGFLKIWDISNVITDVESIDLGKEILDLSVSNNGREIVVGTKSGCQFLLKN